MSSLLRHPLIIALVGVAVTGVLLPYFARRWQNQQKALEIRVGLVTDMSESSMALMAHIHVVHRLTALVDDARCSDERRGKLRAELHDAWDRLNDQRREFEVREAVIGTRLEAYLRAHTVGMRWSTLAGALVQVIEVEGSDADHKKDLEARLHRLVLVLDPSPIGDPSWAKITGRIMDQKAILIKDVLREQMVLRTSWIPWK